MHEEVEFCAEEELVTIVPAFRKDAPLALLSGKYGPFIPQARRPCLSAPHGSAPAAPPARSIGAQRPALCTATTQRL
jgi:hypothetical protein